MNNFKMISSEKHTLWKFGDRNIPDQIIDGNGRVVLALCKICGKAESELVEECSPRPSLQKTAADILAEMAVTFKERNAVYGDNFKIVGPVMALLHPDGKGSLLKTSKDHELFHLWSLLIVKLTRFANSDLKHVDSIRDLAVYAAMIESILHERENKHG